MGQQLDNINEVSMITIASALSALSTLTHTVICLLNPYEHHSADCPKGTNRGWPTASTSRRGNCMTRTRASSRRNVQHMRRTAS